MASRSPTGSDPTMKTEQQKSSIGTAMDHPKVLVESAAARTIQQVARMSEATSGVAAD